MFLIKNLVKMEDFYNFVIILSQRKIFVNNERMARFVSNRYTESRVRENTFISSRRKFATTQWVYVQCCSSGAGSGKSSWRWTREKKKKKKDWEERRKTWGNLNGGISTGRSNDTTDCIREKNWCLRENQFSATNSITNSTRSILDFDSARFWRKRSNSSFLSPSA